MTRDQANLTRCCGPEGCGGNSAGGAERFCIADRCMGWRRQTVMIDRTTNEPAVLGVSKLESLEERWSDHGYCGLAGASR
jgi:hypothetical protein